MKTTKPIVDTWQNCYPSKWKGIITPEAIVHPAKFSSKLIRRIYDHMIQEGWVKEGDSVVDPFGGVALGALDAMRVGLNWTGNELEAKFVELGNGNIALWKKKYPWFKGNATLLQGDSRHLIEILSVLPHTRAVSSPPYADSMNQPESANDLERRLERMRKAGIDVDNPVNVGGPNGVARKPQNYSKAAVSSPPFVDSLHDVAVQPSDRRELADQMGISNSEHVSPIDMEKVGKRGKAGYSGVVASPPYADGCRHTGADTPTSEEHIEGGEIHLPGLKGVVSSPPYSEARIGQESGQEHCGHGDQYGATEGQLGAMPAGNFELALTSPHRAGMSVEKSSKSIDYAKQYEAYKQSGGGASFESFVKTQELHSQGYGLSDGQLSAMRAGDFNVVVTSPPFRQATGGTPEPKPGGVIDKALYERHAAGNSAADGYGKTDGQLANMDEGDFDVAVTSPPFEGSNPDGGYQLLGKYAAEGRLTVPQVNGDPTKSYPSWDKDRNTDYAPSEENLGNSAGDDFWSAARTIVEQTWLALIPGGHAVWVVKGFVKNKQLVDFPGQWRQLCEAVGFVTLHEHHALLVNHKGTSETFEGKKIKHSTAAKSFFRRLGERKAAENAYWQSLEEDGRNLFLGKSQIELWEKYNSLTKEQKEELLPDGILLKNPVPTQVKILDNAKGMAFDESGEEEESWNSATRIDYETVLCMVKPVSEKR